MDKNEHINGPSADKDETVSSTIKASFTVCSTQLQNFYPCYCTLTNTQPVCIPSFDVSKCQPLPPRSIKAWKKQRYACTVSKALSS